MLCKADLINVTSYFIAMEKFADNGEPEAKVSRLRKIVSFIALHIFPLFHSPGNVGRITAFCVDEKHRFQGIGLKLLKEAEVFFAERNCARIEVTSNRRTVAHSFYLSHGYVEDSRKFVRYL